MADYPPARMPLSGWGQALRERLRGKADVINRAVPGSSTLSFTKNYWLDTIADLRPGDRLLIQFGHNDEQPDPKRHTVPWGSYRQLLELFVMEARAAEVVPVLITPIPRYLFSAGRVPETLGPYADSMRSLARELDVALVDLARLGASEMERKGEVMVRKWYMLDVDGHDTVHLTKVGAKNMAGIVERELVRLGLL